MIIATVSRESSKNNDFAFNLDGVWEKSTQVIQCLQLHPLIILRNVELGEVVRYHNLVSLFTLCFWNSKEMVRFVMSYSKSKRVLVEQNAAILNDDFILPATDCEMRCSFLEVIYWHWIWILSFLI